MGKRIKDLTTYNKKLAAQNAYFVIDNGSIVNKVEYKTMASELLSEYTGLSMGGSNRSVKTAIDSIKTTVDDLEDRVSESEKALEWADIAAKVATGARPYAIGDTFSETWRDVAANQTYTIPWRVNHYETLELENGKTATGMWLQMTKALPSGIPFSNNRAFLRCPNGLNAGTYNVAFGATWGNKDARQGSSWSFTLTKAVENGGRLAGFYNMADAEASTFNVYSYKSDGKTLVETVSVTSGSGGTNLGTMNLSTRNGNLNSMHEAGYGWNNYENSALRQYLNGIGAVGDWWIPRDGWDIAPNQLSTKTAFLAGLPSGLVSALVPVKTVTYKNTTQDGGGFSTLYDKVTIPSLSQMYFDNGNKNEGTAHEYYIQLNGTDTKYKVSTDYRYPELIAINAANGANVSSWFRSIVTGEAGKVYFFSTSNYAVGTNASYACRFTPLVFVGG